MSARTIVDAIAELFRPAGWFRDGDSWGKWLAFLKALFALPMSEHEKSTYRAATGRADVPGAPFREAWLVVGRRGGKSFVVALVAVFLACFRDWTRHLAPGERGTVMVIASDRKQARVVFRYVRALLRGLPMLECMIERETQDAIDLHNRTTIEVHTASFRAVRGYTIVAALLDEIAFWPADDSANPDHEIVNALRPAMATIPRAMLLCLSSPYARRGALWSAYRDHYGRDGDPVLVWQADTRTMNPTIPQRVIDEAYERDPASAAAEYGAQFRSDVESFVSREVAEACVVPDRFELPPAGDVTYRGFVDPSGGSQDSFTLAIAHRDTGTLVLDCVRERRPPFSPDGVTQEFADVLTTYGLATVQGDRYAGEWPRERFREHSIHYEPAGRTKSELYQALLPELNSGRVELLDYPRLLAQLCGLERRTSRAGKDSIDHAPRAHDDLINAAAGAIALAVGKGMPMSDEQFFGGIAIGSRLAADREWSARATAAQDHGGDMPAGVIVGRAGGSDFRDGLLLDDEAVSPWDM